MNFIKLIDLGNLEVNVNFDNVKYYVMEYAGVGGDAKPATAIYFNDGTKLYVVTTVEYINILTAPKINTV